jgi:hypothetical protein
VLDFATGLYGDLQGIAGRAMQEIESLDVLMIESGLPRPNECQKSYIRFALEADINDSPFGST